MASWSRSRSWSWSWSCWIHLMTSWTLLTCADPLAPPPLFAIHQNPSSFEQATAACAPGVLATLATHQDFTAVHRLVSQNQNQIFWVGLRKGEGCVVPTLPLKGFRWTEDGGQDSQVDWVENPKETCTSVLCAALMVGPDGSLGLRPSTCKNSFQFICKTKAGTPEPPRPTKPRPATPEPPRPATPEPPRPAKPRPATPEPPRATKPRPATSEPPRARETARPTEQGKPEPMTQKPTKPESPDGPGPGSGPGPGPGSRPDCQSLNITHSRSFRLDQGNGSWILVECWSGDVLKLRCSGRPAMWYLHDDSPANLTTVCLPCAGGFRKDAAGRCVDVDECRAAGTCRHSCLNTAGSFRCFCTDDQGQDHDEDSPACPRADGILVPVLVAVAALVVLVVLVAVAVKCCLMRRSKERAVKKAEKMAMETKEGKESAA